jgi:hypothetical protein
MQAQTLQTRKVTTPWLALVLAAILAAAVVVGAQFAVRGRDTTTVAPPAQTVDRGVGLQEKGMSQTGIRGVGGTATEGSWSFHRPRTDLTGPQITKAKHLLNGATSGVPVGAFRR